MIAEFRDRRMRSWKGKLSIDHFHPNDLGYAGMAEIVAEALEEVVEDLGAALASERSAGIN